MFQEMPALELVSVLGKYKPWKDHLLHAYHHHRLQGTGRRSKVKGLGVERSAHLLWRVCMTALQANANHVDKFAPWIKNVGRNMARCAGSCCLVHTPNHPTTPAGGPRIFNQRHNPRIQFTHATGTYH